MEDKGSNQIPNLTVPFWWTARFGRDTGNLFAVIFILLFLQSSRTIVISHSYKIATATKISYSIDVAGRRLLSGDKCKTSISASLHGVLIQKRHCKLPAACNLT